MSLWIKADQACGEKLDTARWKLNPRHDDFCLNPYGMMVQAGIDLYKV